MRFLLLLLCLFIATLSTYAQSINRDSLLLSQGLTAFEEGDYNESTALFKKLLGRDSLHARAHYYIAQSYNKRKKRLLAARHARLAVRHDKRNVDHLILRHQIGFVHPVPLARARKRAFLKRILNVEPENPYAHTEIAREHALLYLNHKDRVRVTDFAPPTNMPPGTELDPLRGPPARGVSTPGQEPIRVRNPFSINALQSRGYNTVYAGQKADSSYEKAISHLAQAIQSTPSYADAYHVLMGIHAMEGAHEDMWQWAQTMISVLPEDPYSSLFAGYAAYKLNKLQVAEDHFQRGIALMEGVERAVYEDVKRIMNKEQARGIRGDSSRVRAYWVDKDPFFLSDENERLLEHYSRLVFSELVFSEPKLDLRGWDSERGDIYVRYGRPESMYFLTHNIENCGSTGLENIVNFQIFDYGSYQFVFGSLNGSFGFGGQSVIGIPTLNEFVLYSPCAPMFTSRWTDGAQMDYVLRAKSHIRETPTAFELGGDAVTFPYLASQFRGEKGQTDLLVSYGFPVVVGASALPGGQFTSKIGLDAGAFLVTENGVQTESRKAIDEVFRDEMLRFEGAVLWPGTHALAVDPGTYTLSVEFNRSADASRGSNQDIWELEDFSSPAFAMSDILLAYSIEEHEGASLPDGYFSRNGFELKAAPWGVYENNHPVYFYFELYNLASETEGLFEYDVEAALVNRKSQRKGLKNLFRFARRNKGDAVAVRFSRTHDGKDANEYLILETDTIDPGNYILMVRVTEKQTGKSVERRREIFVR